MKYKELKLNIKSYVRVGKNSNDYKRNCEHVKFFIRKESYKKEY